MALNNHQVRNALPAVNLVTLVAAVAVMWWRMAANEDRIAGLTAAVGRLEVEVAVLSQRLADKP